MKRLLLLSSFLTLVAHASDEAPASRAATTSPVVPESEIPLNFEAKKTETATGGTSVRIVLGLIVLGVMAGGAWYLSRKAGRPSQRKNAPQIKILNQHWLGPKKSLAIIRVAGESILIGVTDQNISLIKPLSLMDEEMPEELPSRFAGALSAANAAGEAAETGDDDFQMTGLHQIKDVVSQRLKNMRSID